MQKAENFYRQGSYIEAIKYFEKAVEVANKDFGSIHPNYTQSLTGLALTYKNIGSYDKAEPLHKKILQMEELIFGQMHLRYTIALNNLGELYRSIGKYNEAERYHLTALSIRLKLFEENHPVVADTLHNLALTYKNMGKHENAERYYQQALVIYKTAFENLSTWDKATGKYILDYASSLNGLAGVFVEKGEYDKAESLYLETLEIRERFLGESHPHYALTLNNLAEVHRILEEYGEAEYYHKRALEIRERSPGKNSPEYAQSLNNLATLYSSLRRYYVAARKSEQAEEKSKQAEQLYLQALDIYEKKLRIEHVDLAIILNNLGNLCLTKGDYAKAKYYLDRSLKIMRRFLGDTHPNVALSRVNMASMYSYIKKHDEEKHLLHQALEILRNELGERHPDVGFTLACLAKAEILSGEPEEAMKKLLQAANIDTDMINRLSSIGDEKRLQNYIWTFQANYFALLSIFAENKSLLKHYTAEVYNFILNRKSLNLEIVTIKRDSILSSKDPQLKKQFEKVRELRKTLSRLLLRIPDSCNRRMYLEQIYALEDEIETQEKIIASQVPQMKLQRELENANYQSIANLLPADSFLIEYVWHFPFDFETREYLTPHYLVFILPSDTQKNIEVIDIGESTAIDNLIKVYKDEILQKSNHKDTQTGKLVYDRLFQPLINFIGSSKKLFISPDGDIALLPFEVIIQPNNRYIIQDFEISYVNSGRDLLRFKYYYESQSNPLILANPDFDLEGSTNSATITDVHGELSDRMVESHHRNEIKKSFMLVRELPGTKEEAEEISKIFSVRLWTETDVLDGKLKKVQGPKILHIATHGFFLKIEKIDEKLILGTSEYMTPSQKEEYLLNIKYYNPLLRSGLILAGFNTFVKGKPPAQYAEDGVLTALDVTGMDLRGTELVVLSACETGLGEVLTTEGVYGLRRSFFIAGAKTLITSLWKVPDAATKELMVNFYKKLITEGKEKAEALREAQREMIERFREQDRLTPPYFWGAFICIGDPGQFEN